MIFDLSKKHCFFFNELSKIPRGSRNEKAVSDYIVSFADERGLKRKQDEVYNVLIEKPASPGYEDSEPLILQAHIDMVCEKNKDSDHDFEKDPLQLYVDDEGWLHAKGTTLGADDGTGVAYMLAILDDDTLPHPPLQCIFTAMEEIGLVGASHLKKEDIHGKRLINLDSGGETVTTVSSSGGARARITCPLRSEENDLPAYFIGIRGLLGGHSGNLINQERGNANLLAVRILKELQLAGVQLNLVSFSGGLKYNAIPREADIVFVSDTPQNELEAQIRHTEKEILEELEFSDAGFRVEFRKEEDISERMSRTLTDNILNYMYLMPNGFLHKSMKIEGLTTASMNAGVVKMEEKEFVIEDLIRSAIASHTDTVIRQLELLAEIFGFEVSVGERYSGWNFSDTSPLRKILREVVGETGRTLTERASHGGLETGIFKGLIPEMDIITYGPIASGAHTPDEKLDLASYDRSFEILKEVIRRAK